MLNMPKEHDIIQESCEECPFVVIILCTVRSEPSAVQRKYTPCTVSALYSVHCTTCSARTDSCYVHWCQQNVDMTLMELIVRANRNVYVRTNRNYCLSQ